MTPLGQWKEPPPRHWTLIYSKSKDKLYRKFQGLVRIYSRARAQNRSSTRTYKNRFMIESICENNDIPNDGERADLTEGQWK